MVLRMLLGIIGLMFLWFGYAVAGRPFATSDAETVESVMYELEIGSYLWSEESQLVLEFKHGLTDRMEMGVALGYAFSPDVEGRWSPSELGFKFVIVPGFMAFSLCGEFGLSAYKVKGIMTRYVDPLILNLNIGYAATGRSDTRGALYYSCNVIFRFHRMQIGSDIFGNDDGLQTWLIGINYKILTTMGLDAGITGNFTEDTDNRAIIGVTYKF